MQKKGDAYKSTVMGQSLQVRLESLEYFQLFPTRDNRLWLNPVLRKFMLSETVTTHLYQNAG